MGARHNLSASHPQTFHVHQTYSKVRDFHSKQAVPHEQWSLCFNLYGNFLIDNHPSLVARDLKAKNHPSFWLARLLTCFESLHISEGKNGIGISWKHTCDILPHRICK